MIKLCCYIGILVIYILGIAFLTAIRSLISGSYDDDMFWDLLFANIVQALIASLLIYVLTFERILK